MVTLWALEQFELKCDAFSVKNLARIKSLEHFPTKWTPVRRRKCDQTRARAFSGEVDTGSSKNMRPNKKLERRSDSIGSECALARLSHEGTAVIALARDRSARRKAG